MGKSCLTCGKVQNIDFSPGDSIVYGKTVAIIILGEDGVCQYCKRQLRPIDDWERKSLVAKNVKAVEQPSKKRPVRRRRAAKPKSDFERVAELEGNIARLTVKAEMLSAELNSVELQLAGYNNELQKLNGERIDRLIEDFREKMLGPTADGGNSAEV